MAAEMTDERLAWHLENWARYIKHDESEYAALNYPDHAVGFINGIMHTEDSKELAEAEADLNDAIAMDALIDSLEPYHIAVIYNYWGFELWSRQPKETDYPEACEAVKVLAMKRGIV